MFEGTPKFRMLVGFRFPMKSLLDYCKGKGTQHLGAYDIVKMAATVDGKYLNLFLFYLFYKTIEHFSYFSNHCPCQLFIWWSQIWHYHLWLLGYAPSTMENSVWMVWVEAYAFHNCNGSVRCSVTHTTFWLCLFIWWWPIWQSIVCIIKTLATLSF